MTQQQTANAPADDQAPVPATFGTRFVAEVERQFSAEMSDELAFTQLERTLAQHMFAKVDMQLKALEAKRLDRGGSGTPITWENVDMQKLALDTVHRVGLGLDALIPNHINAIPFFNRRSGKYDLDLRVGYVGKDMVRRKLAVETPVDIVYQLVHASDEFVPHFRDKDNDTDTYEFRVVTPFDRGEVVGGFGYIVYEDARKNRLYVITKRDFERSRKAAQTQDFWNKNDLEMMFKTVVHRVTDKIPIDPARVNAPSLAFVEAQEGEGAIEAAVDREANAEVIDIEATPNADIADPPAPVPVEADPEPDPDAFAGPTPEQMREPGQDDEERAPQPANLPGWAQG